jgi:hypothetical protein
MNRKFQLIQGHPSPESDLPGKMKGMTTGNIALFKV